MLTRARKRSFQSERRAIYVRTKTAEEVFAESWIYQVFDKVDRVVEAAAPLIIALTGFMLIAHLVQLIRWMLW